MKNHQTGSGFSKVSLFLWHLDHLAFWHLALFLFKTGSTLEEKKQTKNIYDLSCTQGLIHFFYIYIQLNAECDIPFTSKS